MATRATNSITSDAYLQIKRTLTQLKLNVDAFIGTLAAETVDYAYMQGIYSTLINAVDSTDSLATTHGLDAYASDQEDDPSYVFSTEYALTSTAIRDAAAWMNNIPSTGRTVKPVTEWIGAATLIQDDFSSSLTAGLRNQLQTVTDSIT